MKVYKNDVYQGFSFKKPVYTGFSLYMMHHTPVLEIDEWGSIYFDHDNFLAFVDKFTVINGIATSPERRNYFIDGMSSIAFVRAEQLSFTQLGTYKLFIYEQSSTTIQMEFGTLPILSLAIGAHSNDFLKRLLEMKNDLVRE